MRHFLLCTLAAATLSASPLTDTTFINALYLDVLNRPASNLDVSTGLAFLAGNSHQQFAASVLANTEYRTDLVDNYFHSYLSRLPLPTELSTDVTALGSGASDQTVQEAILATPEFFMKNGNDNPGFVNGLFMALLGRGPMFSEQTFFEGELTGGATRIQIASQLLEVTEYNQDLLTTYYQQYLDRAPMSGDFASFVPALAAGGNNENVQATILGSVEYNAVAQAEVIPEPATWVFVGAGLAMLAVMPRKRSADRLY